MWEAQELWKKFLQSEVSHKSFRLLFHDRPDDNLACLLYLLACLHGALEPGRGSQAVQVLEDAYYCVSTHLAKCVPPASVHEEDTPPSLTAKSLSVLISLGHALVVLYEDGREPSVDLFVERCPADESVVYGGGWLDPADESIVNGMTDWEEEVGGNVFL